MATGTVKWFHSEKGFGFVAGPGGEDIFVHYSVIEGDGFRRLREGDPVEFEFTTGPKGRLATVVRRIILADPPRRLPRDENGDVNGNR